MALSDQKQVLLPPGAVRLPSGDHYFPGGKAKAELRAEDLPKQEISTARDVVIAELRQPGPHTCVWCGHVIEGDQAFKDHVTMIHARDLGESAQLSREQMDEAALMVARAAKGGPRVPLGINIPLGVKR